MSLPITFYLILVLQIDPMERQITTQTSPTSSTVIRGRHLSHSSEQVIRSVRSLTPTTFSTTTTTCSHRWAELMTISFHRHLAWAGRHMVSVQLLGELACDCEIKNGRNNEGKVKNNFGELDTKFNYRNLWPCFVHSTHFWLLFRSHSFNVHTPLKKEKIQDPPVEHDLYVTLEEINSGCVKKMKISRRVMQPDGTPKKEDKYVSISVKPGWKSGTKVTFQKEGDQTKGKIPSDIVFIIRDKPHPLFRREGSDLRYTARLTLKQVSSWILRTFYEYFVQAFMSVNVWRKKKY